MTVRHRAPQWVRDLESTPIHAILGRLQREGLERDLSAGEERLWSALVDELEYRARLSIRVGGRPCACQFCVPPFPFEG